jgi:hypothetical protein
MHNASFLFYNKTKHNYSKFIKEILYLDQKSEG